MPGIMSEGSWQARVPPLMGQVRQALSSSRRPCPQKKKPSRWTGRALKCFSQLGADYVGRLEPFGALQKVKLHGFTLVERAVAVLLYCGEVHEYVLARGALDKTVPLRPVEPLYCTFLSHGRTPFTIAKNIPRHSRSSPRSAEAPLKDAGRTFGCVYDVQKNYSKKRKGLLSSPSAVCIRCGNFRSPKIWRVSTTPNKRQPTCWSHHRTNSRY